MMRTRITSRELWNDGSRVEWRVEVHEIPIDAETLEWYDKRVKEGYSPSNAVADGNVKEFVVDAILVKPGERINDITQSIAVCEFSGVAVYDTLVLELMTIPSGEMIGWNIVGLNDCEFLVRIDYENGSLCPCGKIYPNPYWDQDLCNECFFLKDAK